MSDGQREYQMSRYLGDGVYASFDGHHVWLHVGDHRNRPVVALEPEVLAALNDYDRDVRASFNKQR